MNKTFHSFVATKMFKIIHNDPDYVVPPKDLPSGEKNSKFTSQHKEERNLSKQGTFKISLIGIDTVFLYKNYAKNTVWQ